MNFQKEGKGVVQWIDLTQNMDQCWGTSENCNGTTNSKNMKYFLAD